MIIIALSYFILVSCSLPRRRTQIYPLKWMDREK